MAEDKVEQANMKARKDEKARRMLEKAMRAPLNDTILQVHHGLIDIKDLITRIEAKVKAKKEEKKNG